MGSLHFNVHFSVHLIHGPAAWGGKIFYLEASKKKVQITDKFLDGIFLGIKEDFEELCVIAEISKNQKKTAS